MRQFGEHLDGVASLVLPFKTAGTHHFVDGEARDHAHGVADGVEGIFE